MRTKLPRLSRFRASLPAVNFGPGNHIVSPQKRASKSKLQRNARIFIDLDDRRRRAQKELDDLLAPSLPSTPTTANTSINVDPGTSHDMEVDHEDEWVNEELEQSDANVSSTSPEQSVPATKRSKTKHLIPDIRSLNLYCKWRALLPTLIEPLLAYTSNSTGKPAVAVGEEIMAVCKDEALCGMRETSVLCLYFDRMYHSI